MQRKLIRGTPQYFEERGAYGFGSRSASNDMMSRSLGSRPLSTMGSHTGSFERHERSASEDHILAAGFPANQYPSQPLRSSFGNGALRSSRDHLPNGGLGSQSMSQQQFLSRSLDSHGFLAARSGSGNIEGDLAICKDELLKTKALLEQDTAASIKFVKEIDVLQRKNSDQVMQLQALLNKSEQARRELEIQVSNTVWS